jgi:hypothetical protein
MKTLKRLFSPKYINAVELYAFVANENIRTKKLNKGCSWQNTCLVLVHYEFYTFSPGIHRPLASAAKGIFRLYANNHSSRGITTLLPPLCQFLLTQRPDKMSSNPSALMLSIPHPSHTDARTQTHTHTQCCL